MNPQCLIPQTNGTLPADLGPCVLEGHTRHPNLLIRDLDMAHKTGEIRLAGRRAFPGHQFLHVPFNRVQQVEERHTAFVEANVSWPFKESRICAASLPANSIS